MAERSERTTIYEVARAGVSPAKISRALREDSRFSEATKQTVRLAASELDYLPRAAASTLALGGRSNALGLVLPHIDGAYYADLLVGFETAASARGLSVIISLARTGTDSRSVVRALAAQVDGIAFMARSGASSDLVREIARIRPIFTAARSRLTVFKNTKNRDAAWKLVQFLTEKEKQISWYKSSTGRGCGVGRVLASGAPVATEPLRARYRAAGGRLSTPLSALVEKGGTVQLEVSVD